MNHPLRLLAVLSLSLTAIGGSYAAARVLTNAAPGAPTETRASADLLSVMRSSFDSEPEMEWVFEGRDVDGDGAADFANPTGEAAREHDGFGSGAFGASRDGGLREHAGVDYVSEAGQAVVAPISGYVTKIGLAYAGDDKRYVEITNPALGMRARVLYVRPQVSVGDAVRVGDRIAKADTLQDRYPGITDHVHLEVSRRGRKLDPETMIVAELRPAPRG